MSMLNLLIALFSVSAAFCFGRRNFLLSIVIPALVIAPVAFYFFDGTDGLIYSVAGVGLALLLTVPLRFFNVITASELFLSIALGAALGAAQYAAAFCIATAFITIQRFMKLDVPRRADELEAPPPGYGSGLLAADEKSALVEIEALKILHRDSEDFSDAAVVGSWAANGRGGSAAGASRFMPWSAEIALATLTVLMLGSSI